MSESMQALLIVFLVGEMASAILEIALNRAAQRLAIDMSESPFVFGISQLAVLALVAGDLYNAVDVWFLAVLVGSFLKFSRDH